MQIYGHMVQIGDFEIFLHPARGFTENLLGRGPIRV
jgi:hypothetical protein